MPANLFADPDTLATSRAALIPELSTPAPPDLEPVPVEPGRTGFDEAGAVVPGPGSYKPSATVPELARAKNQGELDMESWQDLQDAQGMAGDAPERATKKAKLQAYKEYRLKRGERPFQYLEKAGERANGKAWRDNLPMLVGLFAGADKMADALPADQRESFNESFKHSLDPERDKMRAANLQLVSAMTGEDIDSFSPAWDAVRSKFAQDHLGLSGVVTDAEFYSKAGLVLAQEKADGELMEKIGARAATLAMQGKPLADTLAETRKMAGERWKEFAPAARQGHAGILAQFGDEDLKLADTLWNEFQRGLKETGKSQSEEAPELTAALRTYGKADQAGREKIAGLIALRAQDEGEDVTNYFARLSQSFKSGMYFQARGLAAGAAGLRGKAIDELLVKGEVPASVAEGTAQDQNASRLMMAPSMGSEDESFTGISAGPVKMRKLTADERKAFEERRDLAEGFRAFTTDLPAMGVKSKRYLDQERAGFWDTLGDTVVMAAESLPMMATATIPYGGGLLVNAAGYAEEDMATLRRQNPSKTSGELEGLAYTSGMLKAGVDRVQIAIMGARMPKVTAWALAAGIKAVTIGAAETGQEVVQDLTLPMMQDLVIALGSDIEGPDWEKVIADEKAALGDIARVSLLFGIVGGAGHVIADHIDPGKLREILTDREGLAMAGHTQTTIDTVATMAETNPAAAAETLKAAVIETPAEARKANSAAAVAAMRENPPPTAEEAAIPEIIDREDGGFTIRYPDGQEDAAESMEDAMAAMRVWEQDDANLQEQGIRAYLRHLEGYHEGNAELAAKGVYTGKEQSFESWAKGSKERLDVAYNRVKIALRQSGLDLTGDEKIDLADYLILGSSRNSYGRGVTRIAMEINKAQGGKDRAGATVLTPIEEHSEGIAKWLMETGKKSEGWFIENIRETETATNQTTLPDNLMVLTPEMRRQHVVEAFSRLAVANAVGKVADSQLSAGLKAIFRALKETIHAILALAADIKGLRDNGKMDSEFGYWLDVAAGLQEDYRGENMVRAMEAEMLAESMEGMPEIRSAISGKLPHPDTLKANGHPLAGEVQAIYDEIRQSQESGANQAARTRKANEFFMEPGQMEDLDHVRDAMNEQGFDFETPADMLDAVQLSIGYGKPQYGTDFGGESFSIGKASDIFQNPALSKAANSYDYRTEPNPPIRIRESLESVAGIFGGRTPEAAFSEGLQADTRDFEENTGIKVVPFIATEHQDSGRDSTTHLGWVHPDNPGLIFINSRGGVPAHSILAHEWVHNLSHDADKAGLTGKFLEALIPSLDAGAVLEYNLGLLDRYRKEEIRSEFLGNLFADLVTGSDFYGTADLVTDMEAATISAEAMWQEGNPVFASALKESPDDSLSIARADSPLITAIDALVVAPQKKAELYKRMKAKVAEVRARHEARRLRSSLMDLTEDEDPKSRADLLRDLATLEVIAKTLPPAIRGKLIGSFRKMENLKTAKAREAYLLRLLPKIEQAVEGHLQSQFRQAIRREFDRGAIKVSDSRTRGGKIGAQAHAIFEEAKRAMKLEPEQAEATAEKLQAELETANDMSLERLEELDGRIAALELFQDFENADSARLEEGLKLLHDVRTEGRKEWLKVLAARRDLRVGRIQTLRQGLNMDRPIDFAERSRAKRLAENPLRELDEGFMEWMIAGHQKIRRLGELSNDPAVQVVTEEMEGAFLDAHLSEGDMNRADQLALAEAMRAIFGVRSKGGVAAKLKELTKAKVKDEIPVTKVEGFKEEKIKVPKHLVESILRGETSGFTLANGTRVELSAHDEAALQTAWERFSEMEEKDQNHRRIVEFTRRYSAGERKTLGSLNQLEALQIWLTMRQPDQGIKMEALGFDETTRAEMEAWLKPEVKALGVWMVDYLKQDQGIIDELHRSEKGVGLSLVDEYFPIRNDVSRADNSVMALDGQGQMKGGRSVSSLKDRVTNYAPPAVVNAVAVFLQTRGQVNFWKSHVAPMREWGGVIRDDGMAAAIKTRMGETYYQSLVKALERIESGGSLSKGSVKIERVMKGLMKTNALGILGVRMSTIWINLTAVLNVGFEVRADHLVKGMLQVMKRPEAFKDAWNSPAIQRRLAEGASFEAQLAKSSGPSTHPVPAWLNSAAEKGMAPINWADTGANLLGAAVVWETTRNASLRAGVPPEKAAAMADAKVERVLLRSAQPTTRLAKSEFEQAVLDFPLAAPLAMFISEPRKNLGIIYMAVRELATGKGTYGKPMAAQQAVLGLVGMMAAEYIMRSTYAAFFKAKDDEEEDSVFKRFWSRMSDAKAWANQLAVSHLRAIPMAGDAWNAFMGEAFDQHVFDKSNNPLLELRKVPGNIEDAFGDVTPEQRAKAMTQVVQRLGRVIPAGAVFAQGANAVEFAAGLASSNGVSFSDADRVRRVKARYSAASKTLTETLGKTTGEDGKINKDVQAAKWTALGDKLKAELAPLSPEMRKQVLEAINPPEAVRAAAGQ